MTAQALLRLVRAQVGAAEWDRMNEWQQHRAMRATLCVEILHSTHPVEYWRAVYDEARRLIDARQWSEDAT